MAGVLQNSRLRDLKTQLVIKKFHHSTLKYFLQSIPVVNVKLIREITATKNTKISLNKTGMSAVPTSVKATNNTVNYNNCNIKYKHIS